MRAQSASEVVFDHVTLGGAARKPVKRARKEFPTKPDFATGYHQSSSIMLTTLPSAGPLTGKSVFTSNRTTALE